MPAKAPAAPGRLLPANLVVAVCLSLSALGLMGAIALTLMPMMQVGRAGGISLVAWLPSVAAGLALAGGVLGAITVHRDAGVYANAPTDLGMPTAALAGIQGIVHELGSLLVEERGKIATLQEICSAGIQDVRTVSKRVENLTEAALDAETRLAAGVTRAAETTMHAAQALPEVTAMVRRAIAEATSARMQAEADEPFSTLRSALNEAGAEIAELAEKTAATRRDMTALDAAGREIAVASATVISRLGNVAGQIEAAVAALPESAANAGAVVERATQTLNDTVTAMHADESPWGTARREMLDAVEALQAGRDAVAATAGQIAELVHDGVQRIDGVLAGLSPAAAAITSAAEQAGETLAEATAALQASAAEVASQADTLQAAVGQGAERIDVARQQLGAAAQHAIATAERPISMAEDRLASILSQVETASTNVARMAEVSAKVENLVDTLNQGACRLEVAEERLLASGSVVIDAATASATQAGQSAVAVDTACQDVVALGVRLAAQIGQFGDIAHQIYRQASDLPDHAAKLEQALQRVMDQPEPATALAEALAPLLDRIEDIRTSLAHLAALHRAGDDQERALTKLNGISADIGESVRRVQAVLADHDGIWPALQSCMSQVESAAVALVEAAASARTSPQAASGPSDDAPAHLAETLRHLDELDEQSLGLLRHAEALAENVLAGHAPGLPSLLADRTPELLAGIDAATQRLRSVATALALASDGDAVARQLEGPRRPNRAKAGTAETF